MATPSKPPASPEASKSEIVAELKSHGKILGAFVGFEWLVHLVNAVVFQGGLSNFGVHPRTLSGLLGILFAPFLHANFAHLMSNTLPLLVLGWFVMLRRKRDLLYVSVLTALVGGLGTWLIGASDSVHVGASVLIFGYLGYLLVRGILERRFWPIVGSIAVFLLYGGALFGVLPGNPGISWQGHLFGLLGGVAAARLLAAKPGAADAKAKKDARKKEPAKARIGGSSLEVEPRTKLPEPTRPTAITADDVDADLEELRKKLSS
jgi:membrane associated rhomboid family serine protease